MKIEGKQQKEKNKDSTIKTLKKLKMGFHCLENPFFVVAIVRIQQCTIVTIRDEAMTLVINKIRKIPKASSQGKQVHTQEPSINLTFPSIGILNHLFISPDSPAPLPDTQTSLRHLSFQALFTWNFQFSSLCFPGSTKAEIPSFKNMMRHQKMIKAGY